MLTLGGIPFFCSGIALSCPLGHQIRHRVLLQQAPWFPLLSHGTGGQEPTAALCGASQARTPDHLHWRLCGRRYVESRRLQRSRGSKCLTTGPTEGAAAEILWQLGLGVWAAKLNIRNRYWLVLLPGAMRRACAGGGRVAVAPVRTQWGTGTDKAQVGGWACCPSRGTRDPALGVEAEQAVSMALPQGAH